MAYDRSKKNVYTIEGNSYNAVRFQKQPISVFEYFGSNGGVDYGEVPADSELNHGNSGKTR